MNLAVRPARVRVAVPGHLAEYSDTRRSLDSPLRYPAPVPRPWFNPKHPSKSRMG